MPKNPSVPLLMFDTYMATVRNSVGTNIFRNAFYKINGKKEDVLRDGDLSCAIFVSSILRLLDLIPDTHTTVKSTVKEMKSAGWRPVKKPKVGSIIVWGPKTFRKSGETHRHIGFYVGNGKAISNNSKKHSPRMHHWTFGTKNGRPVRPVEAIYWNKKLK